MDSKQYLILALIQTQSCDQASYTVTSRVWRQTRLLTWEQTYPEVRAQIRTQIMDRVWLEYSTQIRGPIRRSLHQNHANPTTHL